MKKILERLKSKQVVTESIINEIETGIKTEDSLRQKLEENRKQRDMSKRQFAINVLGISAQNYNNILNGVQGYRILERLLKKAQNQRVKK